MPNPVFFSSETLRRNTSNFSFDSIENNQYITTTGYTTLAMAFSIWTPPTANASQRVITRQERTIVPDITNNVPELQILQEQLPPVANPPARGSVTQATLRSRPINEYDVSIDIGRMAFPTLFPNGAASFHTSRQREVSFKDYVKHLMRYKDDRFAQHARFRWWAFNTMMRAQAKGTSKWTWKRVNNRNVDIEELRALVNNDGGKMSDIITRKAQTLRGTRPYWWRAKTELESFVHCQGTPSVFLPWELLTFNGTISTRICLTRRNTSMLVRLSVALLPFG